MTTLFYLLYNLLMILALPIAGVVAYFNEKLGASLTGQKEIKTALKSFNNKLKQNPKPVVWLHAASAGEFEQIQPLLSRIRKMDVYIFQTFTSATIFYKVSQDKRFDGVSFLPWDLYFRVNKFIKQLKPDLFINTRHDIWPNLLLSLHNNKVRNILINANLYEDSKRLMPLSRKVNQGVFRYIDKVYTGSSELKVLLAQLYSGPLEVVGDSRFDQVHERALLNQTALIEEQLINDRRVIIYGSVVGSDLDVVVPAIAKSNLKDEVLHVIVPHETNERDLIPWEAELFRHKIKSIRLSEIDQYISEPVIIWNSVGQLADLYKQANLAFIGAGFSTGVHSVTEAAIYSVPAAHGPKYDILAEAIELVDEGLSKVVNSSDELAVYLDLDQKEISGLSMRIKKFTEARLGASDKIIKQEFPLD